MSRRPTRLSRRRLLALLAAASVGACSDGRPSAAPPSPRSRSRTADAPPSPSTSSTPSPSPSPEPTATVGRFEPYEPAPTDVARDAKRAGGRAAQALTTYAPGESLDNVVAGAAANAAPDLDRALLRATAAPLHTAGAASAGVVRYAQLGGLDPMVEPRTASIMVVLRQRLVAPGAEAGTTTRVLDVRVELSAGSWRLARLASAGGDAVKRPAALSDLAASVTDNRRIELPDTCRWDIYAGAIDDRLLRAMRAMATRFPYSVTVLATGHPEHVYGTDRVSNHTRGRAVDIWGVDGRPVVEQQPRTDTAAYVLARELFTEGVVGELGAPWAFDGLGGRSFTNPVHRDHLHVAFPA